MNRFVNRMIGAARLDVSVYEEVEHDRSATAQAAGVVVLASLAAGIGVLGHAGIGGLFAVTLAALVSWVISAAIIWFVGTKLLAQAQTEADIGQLLRTMGFAMAPGLLRIFEIIPVLGAIVAFVVWIWLLVTLVVAVRQALDFNNTPRAIAVCVIGWIIQLVLSGLLGGLLLSGSTPAPAGGAI
ncbi:YIP1 family protein [Salinisphaera sp. Q1T1-3]|uniref:YIP1 family protein n=1 Tax=Salinisphaera sp. Q1T1-3 TaxID=2321229 RepID=UPI000E7692B6|nr:YIP1 family protein [Salinisphaera sp. Q1T1-3]RJS92912.1 hypothetical protein D3260_10195 [Salinisphaera sp. Q1T1-3]